MSLDTWFLFLMAIIALFLTPGPTIMMITSYAMAKGPRVLRFVVPGVSGADAVAISLALFGIAALIKANPSLYWAIRIAGLMYLLWIAYNMWQSKPSLEGQGTQSTHREGLAITLQAFLVTVSNPKGLIFFVGFLSTFIKEDLPFWPQYLTITLTFMVMSAINSTAWGLAASALRQTMLAWPYTGKLSAVILIGAAALALYLG